MVRSSALTVGRGVTASGGAPVSTHVVMFSGGVASFIAAKRMVDEHGPDAVTLLFSDVKGDSTEPHVGEDEDTYRFIDDAVAALGCRFVRVADGRTIWDVFRDRRFLGNSRLANCSAELKQKPARAWLEANTSPDSTTVVIGIDWTEMHRIGPIRKAYAPYVVAFPLCDPPYITKNQMLAESRSLDVEPPRLYALGFSHNNCGGGCVKAGQAAFRLLLDVMPERYARWEQGEADIAAHLGSDVTILRDRTDGTTRSLPLTVLRERSANGFDQLDFGGCGCFTDTEGMEAP